MLLLFVLGSVALSVGVLNEVCDVRLVQCVGYVPGVVASWVPAFRKLVGEIRDEGFVTLHQLHDVLDGELFELGHLHPLDILERYQLLLAGEYTLKEVSIHHGLRWHVEL